MGPPGNVMWTALLCALLLAAAAFPSATAKGADGAQAPTATPEPQTQPGAEDDFAPGMLLFVVIFFAVCLVMMGAGAVLAGVLLALMAAIALGGIVSSSVLVGRLRKRPSSAFRAFFIQLGAVAGIPCGIGVFWLTKRLLHLGVMTQWVMIVGGLCGLIAGVAIAVLFNLAWGKILHIITRSDPGTPSR